jgi:hypothetical protein
MKEKIKDYLSTTTKKRRAVYFMKNERWFHELEREYNKMSLPKNWPCQRKLWHYWNNTSSVPKCPISGKHRKWRRGECTEKIPLKHVTEGYSMAGDRSSASSISMEKTKKIMNRKHGVDNPMHVPEIVKKKESKSLKKWGFKNPSSSDAVKKKRIDTMMKKYGVEHNFIKCKQYMIDKYGVSNPAHIPEVAEKICSNRYKKYYEVVLNGEKIKLQGFEPYGLEFLKTKFSENEILYKKVDMPEIYYFHKNKKRRYYPDFYLPHYKMVVEIKSMYTYLKDFEVNSKKFSSTTNDGYTHLLLIFEKNGKLEFELESSLRHPTQIV